MNPEFNFYSIFEDFGFPCPVTSPLNVICAQFSIDQTSTTTVYKFTHLNIQVLSNDGWEVVDYIDKETGIHTSNYSDAEYRMFIQLAPFA